LGSLSAEVDITLYEQEKHECDVHGIGSGLISSVKTKIDSITEFDVGRSYIIIQFK
jgi:hypothetical protein